MKRVLIVTPHFPPVNAPDMQRVRMSLPYFEEFGWKPYVLAVAPTETDIVEPLLSDSLPAGLAVERVRSIPESVTRMFGVGNPAIRAWPFLYAAGRRLIAQHHVDLVYFSTTMFLAMPLGRIWKKAFGVPYVLDFQDPWVTDYYETNPEVPAPPKYGVARRVHATLEPWTMREADGIIAVSPDYIDTLRSRYAWMRTAPSQTLPFGASRADFSVIEEHPQRNRYFSPGDGHWHGVYVGVVGDVMATAVEILCLALKKGLAASPAPFEAARLHFVGTSYAGARHRPRQTVVPAAEAAGVDALISEDTARAPYYEALQLIVDADFLLVVGSNDPSYTASKIYPYILAGKPLIALVHEQSPVVDVIRSTRAGDVVTFPSAPSAAEKDAIADRLAERWRCLIERLPYKPDTDWARFERYSAREMTRLQCDLFDKVLGGRQAAA